MSGGPTTNYFCDLAFVGGRAEERVRVGVADGRIVAVEPGAVAGADSIRLRGLTLPGMANVHSHAFHRALRSRTQAGRGTFWTWRDLMYTAAERLDPDNYFRLARATFAEMALAGITAVGEFHYVHHQRDGVPYDDPNAMGKALFAAADEAGIRITLLDTLYLHGGLDADGYREPSGVQRRYCDPSPDAWSERVERLVESNTARVGAAVHSVRAVDPTGTAVAAAWARHNDAPLHVHVSEQRVENDQCLAHHGRTPVGLLASVDALGAHVTAIHATHLAADDITRLAGSDATVCMCPTTERDLGDGIGPTAELVAAGVPLTLGTDSHAVIDLFEECRALELHERLRSEHRGIHRAVDLIDAATRHGQRSLGWADAGALELGNRADLVTIDLESVRTAGATTATALEAAVFAATSADVTDVVIDGRFVVRDGCHRRLDVASELRVAVDALMAS